MIHALLIASLLLGALSQPAGEQLPDREELASRLRAAVAGNAPLEALVVESFCPDKNAPAGGAVLFGSGQAIWDRRVQTALAPDRLIQILQRIDQSGFYGWRAMYGGEDEGDSAVRIICHLEVSLGSLSWRVSQRQKGSQFAPLRELATAVLGLAWADTPGTRAASLSDGIEKLKSGELSPVALELLLHHRVGGSAAEKGTIFRIAAEKAELETYEGTQRLLSTAELDSQAFYSLATALETAGLETLPVNLFAPDYIDLRVTVLDKRAAVQARQFGRMTRDTHGEAQLRFDALLDELHSLRDKLFPAP